MRIAIWGVILLILVPMLWLGLFKKKVVSPEANSWDIQPIESLVKKGDPLSEKIRIPCRYLGVWAEERDDAIYQTTLLDDGRYYLATKDGNYVKNLYRGLWGVQGSTMIRRYQDGRPPVTKTEVNLIVPQTRERFALEERGKVFSSFTLADLVEPKSCTAQ